MKNLLNEYFQKHNIHYTHSAENSTYLLRYDVNSSLGSIDEYVFVLGDTITAMAFCEPRADTLNCSNISEYLLKANNKDTLGQFQLDFDTGAIRCRTTQILGSNPLDERSIELLVKTPIYMFAQYGDGLMDVLSGKSTPDEAILAVQTIQG